MATITLNGNSLDPMAQRAEFTALGLNTPDSSQSDYILIQSKAPLTKDQKQQLKDAQATVLEYVPDGTYIAHYPPKDLTPVRALPFVAWAGLYPKQVKVEPVLRTSRRDAPRVVSALAIPDSPVDDLAHELKTVEVVLHHSANADTARELIAKAAGLDPAAIEMHGRKVRLTIAASRLDRIAQIDAVRHIEEYSGNKLFNNVAAHLIQADTVQSAPSGFAGEGEVVAICDTGLDTGNPAAIHPAFAGRIKKLYPLARPNASDPNGHGTHVSGSAVGDGALPDGTPLRGTAPKASLVFQSVLNGGGGLQLPVNLNDLFSPPYNDDQARVHSNSWGDTVADASYSQQSREVDEFVCAHRDCVICFAAGNSGSDTAATGRIAPGSVGPPGTAKNCITVGASESLRPDFARTYHQLSASSFPVNPIASDLIADNPQGIAAFSGRGPTRDHRIKPDVVAPGCTILSTKSSLIDPSSTWGDSPDPAQYMFDAGTSMATPLVAGCAAVVRESFRVRQGVSPSAALVKAMLVNSGASLSGQYVPPELTSVPNPDEGFGLIHLAEALAPEPGDGSLAFWDEADPLDTGDQKVHAFSVPAGGAGLKATLVWTDPPGEALQNDLDLIVTAVRAGAPVERHGNMPPGSQDFDRTNNVEQVFWPDLGPGDVQIVVRAFRVTTTLQSYALVVRSI